MEEMHALGFHLDVELGDAGDIPSEVIEALNEPELDWVNTGAKDNWYCFCRRFGRKYARCVERGEHRNIAANQIDSKTGQLAGRP